MSPTEAVETALLATFLIDVELSIVLAVEGCSVISPTNPQVIQACINAILRWSPATIAITGFWEQLKEWAENASIALEDWNNCKATALCPYRLTQPTPSTISLTAPVGGTDSKTFSVQNIGYWDMLIKEFTTSPRLKLEVSGASPPSIIDGFRTLKVNDIMIVTVTATCTVAGTFVDQVMLNAQAYIPTDPDFHDTRQVTVTTICIDVQLSGPASAKFVSSAPYWSGPGKLSIPIQNLSTTPVPYTASLSGTSLLTRAKIANGVSGTIVANGAVQIDLEALCPDTFYASGNVIGSLDIRVGGILKTSVSVKHACVGVLNAAIVIVSLYTDSGGVASVRTAAEYSNLYELTGGYSNATLFTSFGFDQQIEADKALVNAKLEADGHLYVPSDAWEIPCKSVESTVIRTTCRREQWWHAKARLEAIGY